jgi:hypothetical protein
LEYRLNKAIALAPLPRRVDECEMNDFFRAGSVAKGDAFWSRSLELQAVRRIRDVENQRSCRQWALNDALCRWCR